MFSRFTSMARAFAEASVFARRASVFAGRASADRSPDKSAGRSPGDLQPHVADAVPEGLEALFGPAQSAHGPALGSCGLAVVGLALSWSKGEQLDERAARSDCSGLAGHSCSSSSAEVQSAA